MAGTRPLRASCAASLQTEEPQVTTLDDEALASLKASLAKIWTAGDYAPIADGMAESAEPFLDSLPPVAGLEMLDLCCGTGQIAIPAARRGARVTGLDLSRPWLDEAERRARAEGLPIRFDEGDGEAMPYADASFDMLVSLIGIMFAPRPEVATAEMLRVTRPGGTIAMGNWTPEGFIGRFFRLVGQYAPPPDMPSPLLWGEPDIVRERLRSGTSAIEIEPAIIRFDYPLTPQAVADLYAVHFGPVRLALERLDAAGRSALRADLAALWSEANRSERPDRTVVDAEILRVVATRTGAPREGPRSAA